MPNRKAKARKREKIKKNAQLSWLGRTSNQVKKRRQKNAKKENK
jgi:hypothetical protein